MKTQFSILFFALSLQTSLAATWNAQENPALIISRGPLYEKNLLTLDKLIGTAASLDKKDLPWSGHYWPYNLGMLGYRYASSFRGSKQKDFYQEFMINRPASSMVDAGHEAIGKLSPSEKYDLLIGGRKTSWPLTRNVWGQSINVISKIAGMPTGWEGLCHGWALASIVSDRPTKKMLAQSSDGLVIPFYPQDIKALATLYWAENLTTIMAGRRCNQSVPTRDNSGRIEDSHCRDLNPGTWHLMALNQIGLGDLEGKKRSFVADIDYKAEVWNQPVTGFNLRYFNAETNRYSPTFNKDLLVSRSHWAKDPFGASRAGNAQYILGVRMDLTYAVASAPWHQDQDDSTQDKRSSKSFLYHLELDSNLNIVGGEWLWPDHPDFVWTLTDEALAQESEAGAIRWNQGRFPLELEGAAEQGASRGLPLLGIVKQLIKMSR